MIDSKGVDVLGGFNGKYIMFVSGGRFIHQHGSIVSLEFSEAKAAGVESS